VSFELVRVTCRPN